MSDVSPPAAASESSEEGSSGNAETTPAVEGLTPIQAEQLTDKYESSTSQWLRRQAAMLAMDAHRYLVPETELEALARIRQEMSRGREILPARVLYRLALHVHYQARTGVESLWDEGPFLVHNV